MRARHKRDLITIPIQIIYFGSILWALLYEIGTNPDLSRWKGMSFIFALWLGLVGIDYVVTSVMARREKNAQETKTQTTH